MTELHESQREPGCEPELFITFANTIKLRDDPADQEARDAEALHAWLGQRALASSRVSAVQVERELPAFRELRDLVRELVARLADGRQPTGRHLRALNRVLRDGLHYHQLVLDPTGSDRFGVSQVGDDLAQARSTIAGSLAHYLADHDRERLRICADDSCRWLFVDHSPAGRRRWCDMRTCGNRAKVARHRARARGATAQHLAG